MSNQPIPPTPEANQTTPVEGLDGAACCASLLDSAKILLTELERRASKLRKSRHHNALYDLHIMECAITTIDDIIIEHNSQAERPNV
jgi:hypothetical protein